MPENVELAAQVLDAVRALQGAAGAPVRLVVAFSGGRDSSVLLDLLARERGMLGVPLRALHVDHALQPQSAAWARHCTGFCATRSIPLRVLRVATRPAAGENLEAWARNARYALCADALEPGELLLTGHHADDQFETCLLRLVRDAGLGAQGGMPALRRLGPGWLGRPLCAIPGAAIAAAAACSGLDCVQDPMNDDPRFDRAYLRRHVLPSLRARWPDFAGPLERNARHLRQSAAVQDGLADALLDGMCRTPRQLDIAPLCALAPPLQDVLLRRFARRAGFAAPAPRHLERIRQCVLAARADRVPCVRWPGAALYRYDARLYLEAQVEDAPFDCAWSPTQLLVLPSGVLGVAPVSGAGLAPALLREPLQVRSRRGGEKLRVPHRRGHHSLKHLLQEARVPPWQRPRLPVIYAGRQLVAVADLFIDVDCLASAGEAAWLPRWQPGAAA
jgi:tRNA(Ile)-lysidine synthase